MNLFIRTSIAPYRVDFYNALHRQLDMQMCFYHRRPSDQQFDPAWLESLCAFKPVYLKGIRLGKDSRKWCSGLGKMVRKEKPDVVIVPEFQLPLFQLLLIRFFQRKRFKIVSLCDDSIDMIERGNDFTRLHRIMRSWAPRLLDDIIVVHPSVREWYRRHFGIGQWMPIMMDDVRARDKYASLLSLSLQYQQQYALEGKKVVIFVGRLVKLKNVDLLLKAFSRLQQDAVLIVVGEGEEAAALQQQAASIPGRILFTGRLEGDSLYAWYNLADVLALPSSREAFGAVVNEALLGGTRVAVSSHAGSACLVNEGNGAVLSSLDPEAIAAILDDQLRKSTSFSGDLRPSLMPFRFEEKIQELIAAIKE